MRRRGNKSNKVNNFLFGFKGLNLTRVQVPNVKLRPAEKGTMPRPTFEDCWAQETQLGSDDTMLLDRCPRPFKGLVICATGIPDKVRGAYFIDIIRD
jgi:DNA replication regulator DPB11